MQVRLPNGAIIDGIPEGTSKDEIKEKAISAGLASESDFGQATNEQFKPSPENFRGSDTGIIDSLIGKPGERSVFNAPELNEMSFRALRSGFGGLLTGDTNDLKSIIASNYPEAAFGTIADQEAVRLPSGDYFINPKGLDLGDVSRFGVDVASFIPAGRVVGTGIKQLAKGAAVAGATQTAQEVGEVAAGGNFSPEEVALEASMGPAGQVIGPALVKGLKFAGKQAKDLYSLLKSEPDDVARVGAAISSSDVNKIIPEIMADKQIMQDAADLGLDLNPAHYSGNEIYKEYELGLKMIPQSRLSANEKEAISALSTKADDLIREFGGTTDKSALSETVKGSMSSAIDAIKQEERLIYQAVEDAIPKSQKVIPKNTLAYINKRIEDVGGVKFLAPAEKAVYQALSGKGKSRPTFQRLVEARRNVNSPSGMNNPFANTDKRTRDMLYNAIKEDERAIVGFFDQQLLSDYDKALEIGAKRFAMQDQMVEAFGKDLGKSLFSGLRGGVKGLTAGDIGQFKAAMQRVPEDMRQEVAVSALNDVFTSGARTAKDFSLGGFVNAWGGISRNSAAKSELGKYAPAEAMERMDKIYRVSKGIMDANKKDLNNPSGSARSFLAGMDSPDGLLAKLYRTTGRAAAAEGVTASAGAPGLGTMAAIFSVMREGGKKATQAADELLTSPQFKGAMDAYIKGDATKANRIIGAAGAAQKWIQSQPAEVKRQILRQGFVQYLLADEETE